MLTFYRIIYAYSQGNTVTDIYFKNKYHEFYAKSRAEIGNKQKLETTRKRTLSPLFLVNFNKIIQHTDHFF